MFILGIDTTTLSCSVALLRDDTVLAELTLNIKKTHSERLMPLLDTILQEAAVERESLEAIAVAAGPGSFTGLRIGVATTRALAQGLEIPAVPVCTLEALAEMVPTPNSLICPILDARRNQVYTALYRRSSKAPYPLEVLLEPSAVALNELASNLRLYNSPVVFTGEGLYTYADKITAELSHQAVIAPAPFRFCRAALVALRGRTLLQNNPHASYEDLLPFYLRQPEAERLAAERQGGSEK